MGRPFAVILLLLLPACRAVEDILDEPVQTADTIESGSFDRLWNAAQTVLQHDFDIIQEDRRRGRILARGRPAESYLHRGKRRYYSDLTRLIVEVRIDQQGPTSVLSVRAAQEGDSLGPGRLRRYSPRDRYYGDRSPALMRASSVEQAVLRQIREEVRVKQ